MAQSKLALFLGALATLSFAAAQVPPPLPPPAVPATPPAGNGSSNCDPLKLQVCADLLNGLVKVNLGALLPLPGDDQCCPLLGGLASLDAACFCTAVRANVLGVVNLDVPLAVRLLLNHCGQTVPANFTCPPA